MIYFDVHLAAAMERGKLNCNPKMQLEWSKAANASWRKYEEASILAPRMQTRTILAE